jgi:hypothetical protein
MLLAAFVGQPATPPALEECLGLKTRAVTTMPT